MVLGAHVGKGDPGEPVLRCEASAYPDVSTYTFCESLLADPRVLSWAGGRALGSKDNRVVA